MDILIIADFCGRFEGKYKNRFEYIAKQLSENNNVEVVSSDFFHGRKEYLESISENYPFKITLLHEARYERNISIKRFYGHYIWGLNVKKYLKQRNKPDVIYCAIPTLKAALEAGKYSKRHGIRFIIDIQDLWPEAFKIAFNKPIVSDLIFAPFTLISNRIYRKADVICGVSNTYVERAIKYNKCAEEHVVFLGTELEAFDRYVKENNRNIKPDGEIWLGYCGTLGNSYDIGCVIHALSKLKNPPRFIVMGDGEKRKYFEELANKENVNCTFTGRLSYPEMCGLLSECDIVVNPIVGFAAQSIINKHSDYTAVGLPVVNTQENKEYRDLVEKYKMGFNCKNGDSDELASKIKTLIDDDKLRREMGKNARGCAEKLFDRKKTYKTIIDMIIKQ